MHEQDSITASHMHGKHSGVMVRAVRAADSYASDLGSVPGQVSDFFVIFFFG